MNKKKESKISQIQSSGGFHELYVPNIMYSMVSVKEL